MQNGIGTHLEEGGWQWPAEGWEGGDEIDGREERGREKERGEG